MPRRNPKLISAAERAAEGRRIVARQEQLIAGLKAAGQPIEEAELYLKAYIDMIRPLEAIERRLNDQRRGKTRETRKK